jgi:cation:H+ antiporter
VPYFANWLFFIFFAVCVYMAGRRLPVLGESIAARLGLSATTIGLFVLSIITSLPELVTTFAAVFLAGAPDMALANVLGSNNFNLTAIVALDLLYGSQAILVGVDHKYCGSITVLVLISLAALAGIVLIPDIGFGWIGLPSVIILVILVGGELIGRWSGYVGEASEATAPVTTTRATDALLFAGLSLIVVAAGLGLVTFAERIASTSMVLFGRTYVPGETLVGTALLAVSTSLPEVVVAVAAIRTVRSRNMAIGTLLGSNAFNLSIFCLVDIAYSTSIWRLLGPANVVNAAVSATLGLIVLAGIKSNLGRRKLGPLGTTSMALLVVYLTGLFIVLMLSRG